MRLNVTLECRFVTTPDGSAWTSTMFPHEFWERYLEVFDTVNVVARARSASKPEDSWQRVDGPGVTFSPLPHYVGLWQYFLRRGALKRAVLAAVDRDSAALMRVGSPIADIAAPALERRGQPFAVEVVGDPWATFAPGAVRHPLRPLLRRMLSRNLGRQCSTACAASYVTAAALQKRYPPGSDTFATNYSSIRLTAADYAAGPRSGFTADGTTTLVTVGSLAQMYKGHHILLDSVARCVHERGIDLRLEIVGDGRHRPELESLASRLDLDDRVRFHGELPAGEVVRDLLDRADVFVMPSLTEGLPRALIEAMARGLPCIGSDAGGIPELLVPEDVVPAGDAGALAAAIAETVETPGRLARMAERNFQRAAEYRDEELAARRRSLYRHLAECTRAWMDSAGRRR